MSRLMLSLALPLAAAAQNHEIGLTLGRIDGPSRTTAAGPAELRFGHCSASELWISVLAFEEGRSFRLKSISSQTVCAK